MSYLVLARKYRPTTFTEVVGQEHVTRTLANAFDKDRVHHAFLFCGPRGVGKTTLARILGKALNCENGPTASPCGTCSACVSITDGSAVDYFEMDGASNRGIDSIRELTEAVRYQPAVLRKKVYVIDEVHMLTTEAFNALLKTLEEPPEHVSFVLATTEPHKIPNTILSRCQRYDFKLVPTPNLSAHLKHIFDAEALSIEPGAISLLVRESGGSVRDAMSLSDQVISYVGGGTIAEAAVAEVLGVADRSLTRTLVSALANGDVKVALESVESAVARGVDEVQLARAIVRYLRDLAVAQVVDRAEQLSAGLVDGSAEELADLAEQARSIERDRVVQMFNRMVKACNDLGDTQQPRLVLDLALIEVAAIEPMIPLGDLMERLGALERYLSQGGNPRGGGAPPRQGGRSTGRTPSRARSTGGTGARAAQSVDNPRSAPSAAPPTDPGTRANAPKKGPEPDRSTQAPPQNESTVVSDTRPVKATPPSGRADTDSTSRVVSSSVVLPPKDMLAEWERVVEALGKQGRVVLYGVFSHAKVLSWTARGLEVGFSSEFEMLAEAERTREMAGFLREYYGRNVELEARMLGASGQGQGVNDTGRSLQDVKLERAELEHARRVAEVHENPIYNKLIEVFGQPTKEEINTNV